MKIYEYTPGTDVGIGPSVIALGFFDGVHRGHRALLGSARTLAKDRGLTFAVFTFFAEADIKGGGALYPTEEKLALLESLGVEAVIIADFSSVADISAEDFVRTSLICDMNCKAAVAGFDFRFGKGARGDAELLSDILAECGGECIIEMEHKISGEKISTTKIKELLMAADVKAAREFLGMPYRIRAFVEHGNGVGKSLGFPTLNTPARHLKNGVYRTATEIDGRLYPSLTNVGVCPTFEARTVHAETYIIDFSGDLYGKSVRIFFLDYLREEKVFSSEKELILQINVDKNRVISENGDMTWQEIGLS